MVTPSKKNSQVVNVTIRYTFPKTWKLGDGNLTISAGKRLVEFLKTEFKVEHYCFQLESTRSEDDPEGANYHFGGKINLKNRDRCTALIKKVNLTEWKGMYIAPTHSEIGVSIYSMKNETKVGDEFVWSDKVDDLVYEGKDLPKQLLLWQAMLEQYIKGPVCDRRIVWIWDPNGCGGKSKFCKYMDWKYETKTIGYSDSKDAMYMVSKSPGAKAYFFDLTRTKPKMFSQGDLYASIEQIKNGHFMNSKYESCVVLMEPPHVVVFSNQMPDLESLSKDRWSIYKLDEGIPRRISGKPVLSAKGFTHLKRIPEAMEVKEYDEDSALLQLGIKQDIDRFLDSRTDRVDISDTEYTFVNSKRKHTVDEWYNAIDIIQRNVKRRLN